MGVFFIYFFSAQYIYLIMKFLLSFVVFGSIALAAAELEDDIDALEVGGAVAIDGKDIREKRALGRIYTGSACEYIKLSDITANSGCADGTKFVLKKADTVRKQLLIMSGTPILAFVTKGTKFVACSSYTEVTIQVDCKTVDGLSDVDLSATASPGSFIPHSPLSSRSDARVKSESGNQWAFFQLFFKQFLGEIFRTNFYALNFFT